MANLMKKLVDALTLSKGKRIVFIGDAMEDHWIHGKYEPSQDGCDKFVEEYRCETPGGAANAHRSLCNWEGRGVRTNLFGSLEKYRSTKTRFMNANGRIVFRWDNDKKFNAAPWLKSLALEMIGCADAVLLSDYNKGLLQEDFIGQAVKKCAERNIPCVADCKRHPKLYTGCILKCNQEYQHQYNQELSELVYDSDTTNLVVTTGPHTPLVWSKGTVVTGAPFLPPVACVNHVGAGDCFAAHLTLALACGLTLKESSIIAYSAGRVYVQHEHNRPPQPIEIAEDLRTGLVTSGVMA
jgi:bifunctional ADP-heptose synthase (sugar kinase/adenylyltransferase)